MTISTLVNRYISRTGLLLLCLATTLSLSTQPLHAQNDADLQAKIQKSLGNSHFKNVQIAVANNVVTLSGTVDVYADKESADNKAHRADKAAAIRNQIQVAGPDVPDAVLYKKLSEKIAWDRVGYGTTPFNAIDIRVQNGTVFMSGHAYGPVDKDSAVAIVTYFPGVKDVVDDVQVDPVSSFDDQSRIAEYRAIYGFSALSRYGSDPAKPIRITVINGTVILSGVVDNQTDKNLATMRANQVPGVFKVVNNLQVAGQPPTEASSSSTTVTK
jgi:osmotically-inducible protein OsmY